jgi:hypothetical protein
MPSVQITQNSGSGIGGLIQGQFGNYYPASDGSYTVDVRDAPTLLQAGFNYVKTTTDFYTTPLAPAAATVGAILASGSLSNGTLALTANPDVMRQVTVEVGTGTGAITAGSVAVTYTGNDGLLGTDTFSLTVGASAALTQYLSRGAVTISSVVVTGLTGGTSPWFRMSTTAGIALPVSGGCIDFSITREYDSGATAAIGTLGTSLATVFPTGAPNGTRTYSYFYNFTSPVS